MEDQDIYKIVVNIGIKVNIALKIKYGLRFLAYARYTIPAKKVNIYNIKLNHLKNFFSLSY